MIDIDEIIETECLSCKYKIELPGHRLIGCDKPDKNMTGIKHGMRNGWFFYPFLFDPIWKEKKCGNYESAKPEKNNKD